MSKLLCVLDFTNSRGPVQDARQKMQEQIEMQKILEESKRLAKEEEEKNEFLDIGK